MRTLKKRHTAKYISEVIVKILDEYDIKIEQLFSFTSDNGSNVVRTGLSLSSSQMNESFNIDQQDDEIEVINVGEEVIIGEEENVMEEYCRDDEDCNRESNIVNIGESSALDIEIDHCFIEESQIQYDEESVLNEVEKEIITRKESILVCIRCACHTIELAVSDSCKLPEIKELIKISNTVITQLRTPIINGMIMNSKLKRAKIRAKTRWHSLNDSLESLLNLREFCQGLQLQVKCLYISEENWNKIEELSNSLSVLCEAVI